MKCQAKTGEGKRCTLNASKEVGGKHFCGNHANIARSTQLMHSDIEITGARPAQLRSQEPTDVVKPKGPMQLKPEAQYQQEEDAAKMLETLRTLQRVSAPDFVLVQMLTAWKAGKL